MTEDRIERMVEKMIDALDLIYIGSPMAEVEYLRRIREIDAWADRRRKEG